MKNRVRWTAARSIATLVVVLVTAVAALAAPTPEQKCQAGKNAATGKLAVCKAKAERKLVLDGDVVAYSTSQTQCHGKAAGTWNKLETAAMDDGTTCPSTGDQAAIEDFVDACVQSVAGALGGGSLGSDPVTCAADLDVCNNDLGTCNNDLSTTTTDLATCLSDSTTCDGNLLSCSSDLSTCQTDLATCQSATTSGLAETGQTLCHGPTNLVTACAGTGQDADYKMGAARSFTDNGDGTISDNVTGLMWEKLSDAGGIHDYDTAYNWAQAYATKIATLNSSAFAGFTDWRLPNVVELESLKNLSTFNPTAYSEFHNLCSGGCSTCSCTYAGLSYWTSTTMHSSPANALSVSFNAGDTAVTAKNNFAVVRAVRGGL